MRTCILLILRFRRVALLQNYIPQTVHTFREQKKKK